MLKEQKDNESIEFKLESGEVITDFYDIDDGVNGDDEPDSEKEIIITRK